MSWLFSRVFHLYVGWYGCFEYGLKGYVLFLHRVALHWHRLENLMDDFITRFWYEEKKCGGARSRTGDKANRGESDGSAAFILFPFLLFSLLFLITLISLGGERGLLH